MAEHFGAKGSGKSLRRKGNGVALRSHKTNLAKHRIRLGQAGLQITSGLHRSRE